MVQKDKGEEVSTCLTSGWRVCINYRKLNAVTRKDHFPLPFINQVLERVSGHPFYCFLDSYSDYFQIEIAIEDQEKTTFTCPLETYAYRRMPFRLMQCTGNIPKMHVKHFQWYGGAYYGSLYGRYHHIWKYVWLMLSQIGSCSKPMHWERLGA